MERPGHRKADRLHRPQVRRQPLRLVAGRSRPGNHDVAGAEQVGHLNQARRASLGAQLLDLGLVQTQDADHAARGGVGGGLHRLAALLHQAKAVGETERAREHQRGVFTEAQTGRGHAAWFGGRVALAEAFQGSQAADEDGRLADDGGVEPLGGAVDTNGQ